jgi:two-component system, NarL family, nitrate/nitrite response regulator NarL
MKIALCDDHLVVIEALATVLRARGYDVITVTPDPAVALEVAASHRPDVCVLDMWFPDCDGLETCAGIKRASPMTQVLFLSATATPAEVQAAMAAGATGYLRKDAGLERIIRAIDDIATGMVVMDAELLRAVLDTTRRKESAALAASFLTSREHEVLSLLVEGCTTAEIASALHVSSTTARTHVQNVLGKLGVHSRLEAAAFAVRHGIVRPQPAERASRR